MNFKPGDLISKIKPDGRLDVVLVTKSYQVMKRTIDDPEGLEEEIYQVMPPTHYRKLSGNSYTLKEKDWAGVYRHANKAEYVLYAEDISDD